MKIVDHYPLITTPALAACRDFYVQYFGFQVAFEASWFIYLHRPGVDGEAPVSLAFMSPEHPSAPPGPEVFSGLGAILTLQVDDAQACRDELRAAGAPIFYDLHTEPWGQRRFACKDPSGLMLDICEQVEPAAGFWDRYLRAA